jgi:imidazolonepropionase-like amidohydrolase
MEMAKPDATKNHFCNGTDQAIRLLVQAHVPLLVGTDAPVPGTTYGASVHGEMALLVRDGLTPLQALAAATSVPARCFHLEDRGWIRPGMRADMVLVEGDPTSDIVATRNIFAVWKRGVRVQR